MPTTAIKGRPILFSGPMVRAILDRRKTQTRRLVKKHPGIMFEIGSYHETVTGKDGQQYPSCIESFGIFDPDGAWSIRCPYGQPGDRLWIKTGYRTEYIQAINSTNWIIEGRFTSTHGPPMSKSGKQKRNGGHPGMFMPFWLSQELGLPFQEITCVRCERLQDITENDAKAEGAPYWVTGHGPVTDAEIMAEPGYLGAGSYREGFEMVWYDINDRESWAANPFVWVIEFRRLP